MISVGPSSPRSISICIGTQNVHRRGGKIVRLGVGVLRNRKCCRCCSGGVAEHGHVAVLFEPPHLDIVGDVAPHKIWSNAVPRGAFGPERSGIEALDLGVQDVPRGAGVGEICACRAACCASTGETAAAARKERRFSIPDYYALQRDSSETFVAARVRRSRTPAHSGLSGGSSIAIQS